MIYPMFAMVVLTFIVLFGTATLRVRSVVKRQVSIKYYRVMAGHDVPEQVVKIGRQFSNLFEMPVLFYVAGLAYLVLHMESHDPIVIAWLFVLTRIIHAVVHITYNNVLHRLVAFMASNLCILLMWLWVVVIQVSR